MDRKKLMDEAFIEALVERSNHADLVSSVSRLLLLGVDRQLEAHFDLSKDEDFSPPTWSDADLV